MSILASLFGPGKQSDLSLSDSSELYYDLPAIVEAPAAVDPPVEDAEPGKVIIPAPFGEQYMGLTRVGDWWLPLNKLEVVDFNPSDGCGAEVALESGSTYHLTDSEALSLKLYMMKVAGSDSDNQDR